MRCLLLSLGMLAIVAVLVLWVVPGSALARTEAVLQGEVRDEGSGEPLAGVQVVAMAEIDGQLLDFWTLTGEDGSYRLELPPGNYLVSFQRDDTDQRVKSVLLEPGAQERESVTLAVQEELGQVRGVLRTRGQPQSHARFYLEATRTRDGQVFQRHPVTGEGGEFYFYLPPGTYRLQFSGPGGEEGESRVQLESGETVWVDLELARDSESQALALRLWPGHRDVEIYGEKGPDLGPDEVPFLDGGRTFVPMRFIGEALGARVDYTRGEDRRVDRVYLRQEEEKVTVEIAIGEEVLRVVEDGVPRRVDLDAPARIEEGRTFLPFRAVGEAFGMEVTYGAGADGRLAWVGYAPRP